MSNVDDIIAAESDELERAELPDPLPKTVRVERRNEARSKMFSLRLRDQELARAWLLERLNDDPAHHAEGLTARVERLEHAVFDS